MATTPCHEYLIHQLIGCPIVTFQLFLEKSISRNRHRDMNGNSGYGPWTCISPTSEYCEGQDVTYIGVQGDGVAFFNTMAMPWALNSRWKRSDFLSVYEVLTFFTLWDCITEEKAKQLVNMELLCHIFIFFITYFYPSAFCFPLRPRDWESRQINKNCDRDLYCE